MENVHYDAENDRVTVSGLYYPHGFVVGCSLPVSEVRHEFSFSDEGWVTYEAATPLQEGFRERLDSLRQAHPTRWEVSIPGRGRLWIGHSPFQHPPPGALVLPCATMGLMSEDATETTHYIELRCGFCVEHGCGNDVCDPGEDWTTCRDCEEPPAVCGDGSCDGTEMDDCRVDCGCSNEDCYQHCTTGVGAGDHGFCGATDNDRWNVCYCGVYNTPCDGSEPFCDPDDPLGDVVFVCEPAVSARVRFGCNQLCWEAFGTSGGSCDAGGTGDCVCEGGLAPW